MGAPWFIALVWNVWVNVIYVIIAYKNTVKAYMHTHKHNCARKCIYRVIQEKSAILWEMIVCVILSKKVHMNMGPILNGYRDMVKRRYGPPASTNSNYVINNITTNITCMQVLTIVLLMICNEQNPGSSTSGTYHNKFSKMLPPTSMHLWTRCRVLRVARRSSWRRSFMRTLATHGD